ncbi:MAG: 23S rRNA (adenine(2503)-C(2))-methyltransferase RlmN, partial [Christensenella sp.]|nr:23S rRNA (adenine(2503)-C(2))-methyltransferase RlmN [Christensenella sp.]
MKKLLDYGLDELKTILEDIGEKPFRAQQVMQWLVQGKRFDEMTNLSLPLREKMKDSFTEGYADTVKVLTSKDGTKKYLFAFEDGCSVESVFMQKNYGNTICVSTQVGCRMGCAFCASGTDGLVRNLSAGEMLSQIIAVNADQGTGRNITNIVLMGMGEPFD